MVSERMKLPVQSIREDTLTKNVGQILEKKIGKHEIVGKTMDRMR
jgi:hypothetical protein